MQGVTCTYIHPFRLKSVWHKNKRQDLNAVPNSSFQLEGRVCYVNVCGQVLSQGQTLDFTRQPCASQGLLTFQTHHAKHTEVTNSNQMEHLEKIKV